MTPLRRVGIADAEEATAALRLFADCVRGGAAFENTQDDTARTLRLVDGACCLALWPPPPTTRAPT